MTVKLESKAEIEAQKAEKMPAFGGLNLLHIKRQLAQLLLLIGREGFFDEYTRHDISHVNKMLAMLDWLIPESTKSAMTCTDWLLTVLGIYFHDLGMLVTRQEFSAREASGFPQFRDSVLFAGEHGEDYRHKIADLPAEQQDRFLYQEFVRENHAERIRWWISGVACKYLGVSQQIAIEVDKLLTPLGDQFRRDLGFVAESHHLDDLDTLPKYRVSQPYGDSDAETGNLQYAAVLLRAADLLHITADRTPPITFRVINPTDPLSQQEWAKQMAVTRVRPKLGINSNGEPDPEAPQDTVEIHAFFKKEDGFFGLTAYLGYAAAQLAKCCNWISATHRRNLAPHEFPWSRVDDSNIETEGFIRDAFEFTIDQAKVLDLLTGQTLYNDSSVVLRELAQNALDAIKLRLYDHHNSASGEVRISWDSSKRVLTVTDNGTGMTQEIIRNHLLRVGASLYQDQAFKKSHPGFSGISRFGIGVLSAFMIADSVEVITCHEAETSARRLALRSVHGKYLIRVLDKHTEPAASLAPFGTMVRLTVRQSVKMPDVLKTAKHWIVLPHCKVTLTIDNGDPSAIGFSSPKEVLVDCLRSSGYEVVQNIETQPESPSGKDPVCVVQHEVGSVTIAYAVRWSPYFHEWSFLAERVEKEAERQPIGTCVEGIRVDTNTPDFYGTGIFALANACGENAPKTNVARSGLEAGPQRDALLRAVYRAYCKHAESEIDNLTKSRGHSLTWAVQEAQYLLSPLMVPGLWSGAREPNLEIISRDILVETLRELPIILTESYSGRAAASCKTLHEQEVFWTIECPLFASAENLVRETPGNASIRAVAEAIGASVEFPTETLLCASTQISTVDSLAFYNREISKIVLRREQRRLDLAWSNISDPPRWLNLPRQWRPALAALNENYRRIHRSRIDSLSSGPISFVDHGVEQNGVGSTVSIRHGETILVVGDTPAIRLIKAHFHAELSKARFESRLPPLIGLLYVCCLLVGRDLRLENAEQIVRRAISQVMDGMARGGEEKEWRKVFDDKDLFPVLAQSDWSMIDPSAWSRHRYVLEG